jgi:hypothetical protein
MDLLVTVPDREELLEWRAFKTTIGDIPWREVVAGYHQTSAGDRR